ncbi:hypothetical protein ASD99_29505 [Mesorhizobium sp. Root695]|uniref:hypothetical protein n=1 Tax=Mesorhizobium sp. Root695 TaxID=1736589 RepID=UPI00070D59FF|nr:hypothetical protein [Mesorhizobium sp. Root695]KRB23824.1 hypothetical protein ASD99_29505 [Mesorhizobium sp. Root695]
MQRTLKSDFLGPEDLTICQHVFDQICADARLSDRQSLDAQLLASTVLTVFQASPEMSKADLLAAILSRRNDFDKLAG